MNGEGARQGAPNHQLSRPSERSRPPGRAATWTDVDRELEVRARIVVALDAIEDGNPRMAELALFGLLDDLDAAGELLAAKAA
jgi:hypothetical protein